MSGQPYSDEALSAGENGALVSAQARGYRGNYLESWALRADAKGALDAAHDREALGLDASVCARTFLAEMRQRFSNEGDRQVSINIDNANAMHYAMDVLDEWVREFGDGS